MGPGAGPVGRGGQGRSRTRPRPRAGGMRTEREGARRAATVSRMTDAARSRHLRSVKTRRKPERDIWLHPGRERGTDPADPLETLQRAERTERVAIRDDPGGQRRPDPRQSVQIRDRRHIHIYRADTGRRTPRRGADRRGRPVRGGARRRGRVLAWRAPGRRPRARPATSGTQRRVDRGDLPGEGGAVRHRGLRPAPRGDATGPDPEDRHGGHEQQRTMLGGSRHGYQPSPPDPLRCHRRLAAGGGTPHAPGRHRLRRTGGATGARG